MFRLGRRREQDGAQKREPRQQAPEVVSGGGEDGVDGVALRMGEEVAAHSVFGLEMADDRLDGGASPQFALDLLGDAPPLARDEHPELVFLRRVVAAIAAVGDDAVDRRADLLLHLGDHQPSVWPS